MSACRKNGAMQWVHVKSLAGEPCEIRLTLEGSVTLLKNGKTKKVTCAEDGSIMLDLKKGEEALLFAGGTVPELNMAPAALDVKDSCGGYEN